jgi:predicted GNAT superfamily acetyltransferase
MREIIIRPLQTMAEMAQVEQIQRVTWNMQDLEIIPVHLLHALQHNGAALLGAFDGENVVGFALGVVATVEELHERIDQVAAARLKMFSVITGVLPAYQKHSVGYRLKMAQREFANRIGIRLITWTYDPLESLNGRFNIGKLGCVCRLYRRNFHGDMGGINAGLPTDRFEVEWWVTGNRAQSRANQVWRPMKLDALVGGGALLLNETTFNAAGLPVPPTTLSGRPGNLLLVEIPADFQLIKRTDFELARRWREHTRALFEELFADGFMVTDFVTHSKSDHSLSDHSTSDHSTSDREGEDDQPRSFYLLTHQDS